MHRCINCVGTDYGEGNPICDGSGKVTDYSTSGTSGYAWNKPENKDTRIFPSPVDVEIDKRRKSEADIARVREFIINTLLGDGLNGTISLTLKDYNIFNKYIAEEAKVAGWLVKSWGGGQMDEGYYVSLSIPIPSVQYVPKQDVCGF